MAAILEKFKLFDVALIWLQIRNLRPRISGMRLFKPYLFIFDACLLLLAKIFNFGKYVRLTVCLSVCLSVMLTVQVAPFKQSTPNLAHVCILDLATGV